MSAMNRATFLGVLLAIALAASNFACEVASALLISISLDNARGAVRQALVCCL